MKVITPLLAPSWVAIDANRSILCATRYRVAASRRRLNPAFAVTGGSADGELRDSVRSRLSNGTLFPVGGQVLAGRGSGHHCVVCRKAILTADVEYEIDLGDDQALVAHMPCYVLWRAESDLSQRDSA